MAVKIKLKRLGRTRVPTYRIVVADARTKRDGRAIEEIGKYHPKEEPSLIEVDSERAQHWLSVGAQPTPPVMNILKITGDWQKFRGEPGAEGTLRTAETAADKKEVFAAALKEAAKDDTASSGSKGGGRARKSDTARADKDTAKAEKAAKADSGKGAAKAEAATAEKDTAEKDTAKAEKSDAKAEKPDAKAETAKAEKSDAKADGGKGKSKAAATSATAAEGAGDAESSEPGSEA